MLERTTRKTHVLSTTPFVKVLVGYLVRLTTTCERLTNSLPTLSLTKNPCPVDDAICEGISGVFSPFDHHLRKVNQ